jgi:hypothetical protein
MAHKTNQMIMRLLEGKDYDVAVIAIKGVGQFMVEAAAAKTMRIFIDENIIVFPPMEVPFPDQPMLKEGEEPAKGQVERYLFLDMVFCIEFHTKSRIVTSNVGLSVAE